MSTSISLGSVGRFALILLCLAMVLLLVVVTLPVYLDTGPLKALVEGLLTEVVEVPVSAERAELRVSLWPTLRLHEVSVAGSAFDTVPSFARVKRADIRLSLLPLLGKRLEILAITATGLEFHVLRPKGRTGNWPVRTTFAYDIVGLENLSFQDIEIEVEDQETGLEVSMHLEQIEGAVTPTESLHLVSQGRLEELPLFLSVSGPTLTDLKAPTSEFPLSAVLELSNLRLQLDGVVSQTPAGRDFEFAVGSNADNLSFLAVLTSTEAPDLGGFDLEGEVSKSGAVLSVSDLAGTVGGTSLKGSLTLNSADERPRLEGRIATGRIDLSPWLRGESEGDFATDWDFPFSALSHLDAQLEISIAGLDGIEAQIADLSTHIALENGLLEVPFDLHLEGIPIDGSLTVDATADTPTIRVRVGSRNVELDQVRSLVELDEALDGSLGGLEVEVEGSGVAMDEIAAGATVRIQVETARLTIADETGERAIGFLFETLNAVQRPQQPLQLNSRGELFGDSFTLHLETAPLDRLVSEDSWPIDIVAHGAGAKLTLNGYLFPSDEGSGLDVDLAIAGDRIGDLDNWIGVSSDAELPYRLRGHLQARDSGRSLRLDEASIGSTELTATFDWDAEDEAIPLAATIDVTLFAASELQNLFDPVTKLDAQEDTLGFDLPILPSTVEFRDTDLSFSAQRIDRDTVDLYEVQAGLLFRDGWLRRSPFSFRYSGDSFNGEIALDLRGDAPMLALQLTGEAEGLGGILELEEIANGQNVTARRLELRVDGEGSTLRRLIGSANISGSLDDVRWQLSVPESDEELILELDRVDISGPADQPIVVQAGGRVRSEPLELRLEIPVTDELGSGAAVPFQLDVDLAQTRIGLAGEMTLPIEQPEIRVAAAVSADRLDTLGPLLGHDLPRIGPYRLTGQLAAVEGDYSLTQAELVVGSSELTGEFYLYSKDPRPRVVAKLSSQQIHAQDFLPPREDESGDESPTIAKEVSELRETGPKESASILEALESFDAELELRLGEIVTADGTIDALTVNTMLEGGYLDFLLQREAPNGDTVDFVVRVEPSSRGIDATMNTRWERLPYGALSDIIDPGIKKGFWSVDVELDTHGESIDDLFANLSGHLDFTDYPEDFRATVFDLWGGGLLKSLLPVFNLGEQSKLNCTVGLFTISEGLMIPDKFVVDTTRSRVRGKGKIDLKTAQMNLKLKPRPKNASLVNLATPVRVRGPISDPSVSFTTGGVALTAFRFYLWIYTVWADILRRPLPADGHDICVDPLPR